MIKLFEQYSDIDNYLSKETFYIIYQSLEEFNDLMDKLEERGFYCSNGYKPSEIKIDSKIYCPGGLTTVFPKAVVINHPDYGEFCFDDDLYSIRPGMKDKVYSWRSKKFIDIQKISNPDLDPYGEEEWFDIYLNENLNIDTDNTIIDVDFIVVDNEIEYYDLMEYLDKKRFLWMSGGVPTSKKYSEISPLLKNPLFIKIFYFVKAIYIVDKKTISFEDKVYDWGEKRYLSMKYKHPVKRNDDLDPYGEEDWGDNNELVFEQRDEEYDFPSNMNIMVHNLEEYDDLMEELEKNGYRWRSGRLPTEKNLLIRADIESNFLTHDQRLIIIINEKIISFTLANREYFSSNKVYDWSKKRFVSLKEKEIIIRDQDPYGEEDWKDDELVFEHKLHKNQIQLLNYIKDLSENKTFIFLDSETSGLGGFKKQQLTQISAISSVYNFRNNEFEEIDNFSKKIKLTEDIIKSRSREELVRVLKFNRYGDRSSDYIDEKQCIDEFLDWVEENGDPLLIIQNASFDMNMLCGRSGIKIKYPVLDTKQIIQLFVIPITQKLAEDSDHYKNVLMKIGKSERDFGLINSSMSKWGPFFGVNMTGYHDALSDCRITMNLFKSIIQYIEENKNLNIQKYQMERIRVK